MGYLVKQIGGFIAIKKENQDKARKALQEKLKKMIEKDEYLPFIRTERVLGAEGLEEALRAIRYNCEKDYNGNIVNLFFRGQKIGCDKKLFAALAPFVETESYLSYEGEDGKQWTLWFSNGKFLVTTAFVGKFRNLLPFS